MNDGNRQAQRLMDILEQNLLQQNYQLLYSLAESPGLNKNIRQSIKKITKYIEDKILQSNIHEIDIAFYRDNIQAILHQDIPSEEEINHRLDITVERRREVLGIIEKIKQLQELVNDISKNNATLEIKNQESEEIINRLQRNKQELSIAIRAQQQKNKLMSNKYNDLLAVHQNLKQSKQKDLNKLQQTKQLLQNLISINKSKDMQNQSLNIKLSKFQQNSKIFQSNYLEKSTILEKQLQQKINQVSLIKKQGQEKIQLLEQQLNQKLQYIAQVENQFSIVSQQNASLRQQIEQLNNSRLKSLIEKSRKSKSQIFMDSNSLIQHFQLDQDSADSLIENIKKNVGEVTSMTSLFNFSLHKGENFHKRVDNRPNILLLCLTEEDRIIGGFTSAGFSLKNQEKNTKAFIFNFDEGKMNTFKLKPAKRSTIYDCDYLIFGNEELCIERKSNKLNSSFVNGEKGNLHYEFQKGDDRSKFLTVKGDDKTRVKLKNYELVELTISR